MKWSALLGMLLLPLQFKGSRFPQPLWSLTLNFKKKKKAREEDINKTPHCGGARMQLLTPTVKIPTLTMIWVN